MSYGHAEKIAAILASHEATAGGGRVDPPGAPPQAAPEWAELYDREDVRHMVADRDIGALYRALHGAGVPQRRIAELTGQSQSEVSEIVKGRRVRDVTVLERICDGLGIPRARMGLSYGDGDAYGGLDTTIDTLGAGAVRTLTVPS